MYSFCFDFDSTNFSPLKIWSDYLRLVLRLRGWDPGPGGSPDNCWRGGRAAAVRAAACPRDSAHQTQLLVAVAERRARHTWHRPPRAESRRRSLWGGQWELLRPVIRHSHALTRSSLCHTHCRLRLYTYTFPKHTRPATMDICKNNKHAGCAALRENLWQLHTAGDAEERHSLILPGTLRVSVCAFNFAHTPYSRGLFVMSSPALRSWCREALHSQVRFVG